MNRGRLIGGIVCLALAALLGVLSATRPENVSFMMDGENRPWVPVVALAVIGGLLLGGAFVGGGQKAESQQAPQDEPEIDPHKAALNKRLETIGWGLFLIMLGGFLFVPRTVVSRGLWSIGVGLIFLGLNAARYFNKIRMSGFTTFLGILSLIGGILQLAGLEAIEGAFLFIILGAALLLRPVFEKRKLFGKAEEA
jgi:hypothetical protein